MRILQYTDPHIGLSRRSHTTSVSATALKTCLNETVDLILGLESYSLAFCLGDLFDSYSNDESDIATGMQLADKTTHILAGNHDVVGRADKLGSLQLLRGIFAERGCPEKVILAEYGAHTAVRHQYGKTSFVFVPHTATQELFEKALQDAETISQSEHPSVEYRVLCLHCNYDLGPALTKADTTLNLTQERAYQLLRTFHRILIGHEHNARQDAQTDRIQILGNTFPTSFSDLTDKFYWIYDTESGDLTPYPCWSVERSFKGSASHALTVERGAQFYDIEDDLPPGQASKLVTKLFSEGALAVRLNRAERTDQSKASADAGDFSALPELIEAELAKNNPTLLNLFREYLENVKEN